LTEAAVALREGEFTSVEITQQAIERADEVDGVVGTYLSRFNEQALAAARRADSELVAGRDRGPLHGIPFGIKDIIACSEGDTTAQSTVLDRSWGAGKDAPVVRRVKEAGAVITGKTTTMEFACGITDASKPFPIPRNPWDLDTWPGGSSSGTSSGVAAEMFYAGLGTDTAGSIRIPAAYCGVTGLMPTYGRVPKSGVVPLSYSLDHVGPIARSAADCSEVLQVIAGAHQSDPTCVQRAAEECRPCQTKDLAGLRVGVVRENHFPEDADPALVPAFETVVDTLRTFGAQTRELKLPYWTEMIACDIVTMATEALAYHRVDTQRWGDYFPATRQMLARGALVAGADYVQAQRVRRVAQHALLALFETVDVVVCPTIATGAPPLASLDPADAEAVERIFARAFTPYWDPLGNPVLAMPIGFTEGGMPLSAQVAGRPFDEATVLRVGISFQSVTDHHLKVSPVVGGLQ